MIGHGGLLPDVLGMSRGITLRYAQTIEDLGFDRQFIAETRSPLAQLRYPPADSPWSHNY